MATKMSVSPSSSVVVASVVVASVDVNCAHVVTARAGLIGLTKALAHVLAECKSPANCTGPPGDRDGARARRLPAAA